MWDVEDGTWWNDGPVVIQFPELALEICCSKLELLSMTANTIDFQATLTWCGDPEFRLAWKASALDELRVIEGLPLQRTQLFEVDRNASGWSLAPGWALAGVVLDFGSEQLLVHNGLDCNAVRSTVPVGREYRLVDLAGS